MVVDDELLLLVDTIFFLIQIYLIDMCHRPDDNWIGHFMDHWLKIHVLFPLMQMCFSGVFYVLFVSFCFHGLHKESNEDKAVELPEVVQGLHVYFNIKFC